MGWREWTGVGERRWKKAPDEEVQPSKTVWDWLQLLIVPAILIAITFAWSASQTRSDNKREDRRTQDATLQGYLDQMSGLMLDRRLLTSNEGDAVRAVARTVTLATLRRVDGGRRGEIVRFLYEAGLLWTVDTLVYLKGADLGGADLRGAYLHSADLGGTYLGSADFGDADLTGIDLGGADLAGADLGGAILAGAYLGGATNLDLGRYIADLSPERQKSFLASQKVFLDSLSRKELATFNLSPEKLANVRREASGP